MQAIVDYLARSPQAADTAEGIAQWWMREMGLEVPPAAVEEALERLLELRLIECSELPDGSVIYRGAPGATRRLQ